MPAHGFVEVVDQALPRVTRLRGSSGSFHLVVELVTDSTALAELLGRPLTPLTDTLRAAL